MAVLNLAKVEMGVRFSSIAPVGYQSMRSDNIWPDIFKRLMKPEMVETEMSRGVTQVRE